MALAPIVLFMGSCFQIGPCEFGTCRSDSDCGTNSICQTGTCINALECQSNVDCPDDSKCIQRPPAPPDNPFSSEVAQKKVCDCGANCNPIFPTGSGVGGSGPMDGGADGADGGSGAGGAGGHGSGGASNASSSGSSGSSSASGMGGAGGHGGAP